MNIRFIDTSILLNILDIPGRNADKDMVTEEFKQIIKDPNQTLILPLATIIETGNHIAHISNGCVRREKGELMADLLKHTAEDKAPWKYYDRGLAQADLLKLAERFPDSAMMEMGVGDLSIIFAYEKYKEEVPAIGSIMIWSMDEHLAQYKEEMCLPRGRKKR